MPKEAIKNGQISLSVFFMPYSYLIGDTLNVYV